VAHYSKGDLDSAMTDYNETIRLRPDHAVALYNRALARADKGDLNGAIKDYTESIRLAPEYVNAYWSRGSAWFNKGDYYSAVADYEKYFELGGKDKAVKKLLTQAKKKIKK
jgi:tetratricopeptide (TPR) repeat protein